MDPLSLVPELAKQGLGYVLSVILAYVVVKLDKDRKAESTARINDGKEYNDKFQKALKDMSDGQTVALEKATKVADATFLVVQNLQTLQQGKNVSHE